MLSLHSLAYLVYQYKYSAALSLGCSYSTLCSFFFCFFFSSLISFLFLPHLSYRLLPTYLSASLPLSLPP